MNINYPNLRKVDELSYGNNPNKLILHHVEWKGSPEDLNEMMISMGFSMCGYNYYVRMDGSIYAMRPVEAIGANCYGQNNCSIGIGSEGNFMVDRMPKEQQEAIVELCKYLMQQYPRVTEIGPHKKYYNTECPGVNFPTDQIISAAMGSHASVVATEKPTGKAAANPIKTTSQTPTQTTKQSNTILDLQKTFNRLNITDQNGKKLVEDGICGSCTTAAVENFQRIVGLHVDGIAGDMTWNAIDEIESKPLCSINQKSSQVVTRYIQYRMATGIDGVWGTNTDTAVKVYQRSKGLKCDGIVGQDTWISLIG